MTSIIYRRDPKKPTGPWTSDDGVWTGSTWLEVHDKLQARNHRHGVPQGRVHDTPVAPWSRVHAIIGGWKFGDVLMPAPAPTPEPAPDPESDSDVDEPNPFSLFDD